MYYGWRVGVYWRQYELKTVRRRRRIGEYLRFDHVRAGNQWRWQVTLELIVATQRSRAILIADKLILCLVDARANDPRRAWCWLRIRARYAELNLQRVQECRETLVTLSTIGTPILPKFDFLCF